MKSFSKVLPNPVSWFDLSPLIFLSDISMALSLNEEQCYVGCDTGDDYVIINGTRGLRPG